MPIIKQYICDNCEEEISEKKVHTVVRVYLHKNLIMTNPKKMDVTKMPAEQRKEVKILCSKCSDKLWTTKMVFKKT